MSSSPDKFSYNFCRQLLRQIQKKAFGSSVAGKFLSKNIKVEHDFIQVDALTSWGQTKSDVHMHVFPKKEVLERQQKPGGIPLNIALIMFDSTSAANFRRKMPNSLEYLTDDLNSLLMRGEDIFYDINLHRDSNGV